MKQASDCVTRRWIRCWASGPVAMEAQAPALTATAAHYQTCQAAKTKSSQKPQPWRPPATPRASCTAGFRRSDGDAPQTSPCHLRPQPPPSAPLSLPVSISGAVRPALQPPHWPYASLSGATEGVSSADRISDFPTGRYTVPTGRLRLGDNPKLLFHAPTPTSLSRADDLNRAVGHSFKVDLTVGFKVANFGMSAEVYRKAGLTGRLPRRRVKAATTDRDALFGYINSKVTAGLAAGEPAISIDTKKKELGHYRAPHNRRV